MLRLALALLLPLLAIPAEARSQRPFPVAVRDGAASDGWTDPNKDRADSARDVIFHLTHNDPKWIRFTPDLTAARILVDVLERSQDSSRRILTVRVTAGTFQTVLTASTEQRSWFVCAGKIVKRLNAWAEANQERLADTQ